MLNIGYLNACRARTSVFVARYHNNVCIGLSRPDQMWHVDRGWWKANVLVRRIRRIKHKVRGSANYTVVSQQVHAVRQHIYDSRPPWSLELSTLVTLVNLRLDLVFALAFGPFFFHQKARGQGVALPSASKQVGSHSMAFGGPRSKRTRCYRREPLCIHCAPKGRPWPYSKSQVTQHSRASLLLSSRPKREIICWFQDIVLGKRSKTYQENKT